MPKIDTDNFNPIKSTQLFGFDEHFNNLITLHQNNKLPKIILLTGEKGLGKFTFGFHFVNFFFFK